MTFNEVAVPHRMMVKPVQGAEELSGMCLAMQVDQVPGTPVPVGGWMLMGGVDPLLVGSFEILLPLGRHEVAEIRLTNPDGPAPRIHLFRLLYGEWVPIRAADPWVVPLDSPAAGTVMVSAVVEIPGADDRAGGRHSVRRFGLDVVACSAHGAPLDTVRARFLVPPVLLPSSADPVEELWVVGNAKTASFVAAVERIVPDLGVALRVPTFPADLLEIIHQPEGANAANVDVWLQDAVAIGRMCVPGPDGPDQAVAALGGVRAPYPGVDFPRLDLKVRDMLRQGNAVLFEPGSPRPGVRGVDWYGNLQVSPPVCDSTGRAFPHGRVLTGTKGEVGIHPGVLEFLASQASQVPPLTLDTSWLKTGHIDEVVSFIPVADGAGFRAVLPDPALARDILLRLERQGHGKVPVFRGRSAETTVSALLHEVAESDENRAIESALGRTQADLMTGLGIAAVDFIGVPALFRQGVAVVPNPVNCVVCNGHVLVADPEGPVIDGEDVFAQATRRRIEPLGLVVHFIDAWDSFHVSKGGVHCGTNTVRRISSPAWWSDIRCDGTADGLTLED